MNEERSRRGRNAKARGKSIEREVLRRLNALRMALLVAPLARNRDGGPRGTPDLDNGSLVVEVKSHQTATPKYISDAWGQAKEGLTAGSHMGNMIATEAATVHSWVDSGKRTYWWIAKIEDGDDAL